MRIGHRLRRALVATLAATAALAVAAPGMALAADPPTILTAGIDAQDQLYATWSLAPGTTFGQVEFATLPWPDRHVPFFFLEGQFAGYESCRKASCAGTTTYTGYSVQRDRRFFVKVTARVGDERLTSAVWVIDETKPVIPGDAEIGDGDTNAPVAGRPWDGASLLPPGIAPTASIRLLKVPKTIRGLLRMGVSVRATSSVAHSVQVALETPAEILGLRSVGFATGGTHTTTAKIDADLRAPLRRLKRVRVALGVLVTLADGTIKRASRSFTVRR